MDDVDWLDVRLIMRASSKSGMDIFVCRGDYSSSFSNKGVGYHVPHTTSLAWKYERSEIRVRI